MKKRKIGVDVDDVLIDFNEGLRIFHNTVYGTSYEISDIIQYELQPLWGCGVNEIVQRIDDFYHSDYHRDLSPVAGAVDAIKELLAENFIIPITSRPESVRGVTEDLLARHFRSVFEEMHFLSHYRGDQSRRKTKGEVCRECEIEFFVEDHPAHAETIGREGVQVFLLDRPWNQGVKPTNTRRVFGWDDILAHLL
jgi:uncharacterized HAD superfamily protein